MPGKINLNTIWDPETWAALCDAQPANGFTAKDVSDIYDGSCAGRTDPRTDACTPLSSRRHTEYTAADHAPY